jgi:hypothetical protein
MKRNIHTLLIIAAVLLGAGWSAAEPAHSHGGHGPVKQGGLVETAKAATRHFRDVNVAIAEGYGEFLGCVSGPGTGAMGVHYANGALVGDGVLDADRPAVLVYEPRPFGGLGLVAVEYLVLADLWHAEHETPPVLEGQVFHYTGSPNRYGLPAFYALHVWVWKHNPSGMFADWNPNVTCEHFAPGA